VWVGAISRVCTLWLVYGRVPAWASQLFRSPLVFFSFCYPAFLLINFHGKTLVVILEKKKYWSFGLNHVCEVASYHNKQFNRGLSGFTLFDGSVLFLPSN
jgi:hypothetical protein